ncbi:MAG: hypothetical protein B7Y96_06775 [Comamonadaceae bacterium 32-67-11]|nr:MAG: hypothetical protein B7Y96_06775 [Comamonadaceae bacterium 32-67-11]
MHTPTTRPPHNRRTSQAPVAAHGAPGRPAQRPRHGATSVLRQRGLTLIEVLVALLLGLLLIGAVGGLYLANHQTFRQVENMARVNENARLAFELPQIPPKPGGTNGTKGCVATTNRTQIFQQTLCLPVPLDKPL